MSEDNPLADTIDHRYFGGFAGDYANAILAPLAATGVLGDFPKEELKRLTGSIRAMNDIARQRPDIAANSIYFGLATMYRGSPFSERLEQCLHDRPIVRPIVEKARQITRAQTFDAVAALGKRVAGNIVVTAAISNRGKLLPKALKKNAGRKLTFGFAQGAVAGYGAMLRIAKQKNGNLDYFDIMDAVFTGGQARFKFSTREFMIIQDAAKACALANQEEIRDLSRMFFEWHRMSDRAE